MGKEPENEAHKSRYKRPRRKAAHSAKPKTTTTTDTKNNNFLENRGADSQFFDDFPVAEKEVNDRTGDDRWPTSLEIFSQPQGATDQKRNREEKEK